MIRSVVVDFYFVASHLVVEVDGDIHHYQADYDTIRTKNLEDLDYCVIRYRNDIVLDTLNSVPLQIKKIALEQIKNLTPIPSSVSGEGERG